MAETNAGVWGIDLGQCALKAIRLEEVDGQMTATAFDYVEHPKILSQPDADPDELTREALTKFLERNSIRGDLVAISVPGQSGLARFVKLPPVEEKKIADIVRFEAKQQIPFNLEEVVWDYQKIGSGQVTDGYALETEIGLFAMKRDMIGRYLQHFKEVGVDVQIVQMAPLALCNYVAYDLLGKGARVEGEDSPKTGCVVALDIGADSSNLVITDGDRVIWQRPIPLGGNHFTRALTKEMKLTFAKAEHLKRNAVKSPDLKKILASLKPVLNDFVGEVQRSLGYFTNTHRNAQIDYMIGLGNAFRLPGLQKYLGEKLQLEVRKVVKMERLTGDTVVTAPTYTENILSYGVAYGLALQGLKTCRIQTNLLPGEIRTERMVKAKKPYAVAAAAVLLLGICTMSLKAWWADTRPWGTDDPNDNNAVTVAIKKGQDATKRVAAVNSAYQTTKDNGNKEAEAVKSITAGQDEQLDWIELMQFITQQIPKPDGSNLSESAKPVYWRKKAGDTDNHPNPKLALTGEKAWEEYRKQLAAGAKVSGDREEPGDARFAVIDPLGRGIDDRVQFNIEMVNTRYCGDLAGYWERVSTAVGKGNLDQYVRPVEHAKTPPKGKGWVVELQGYTFHYQKVRAVRDTLVDNLVRAGIPNPVPEASPSTTTGGGNTTKTTPTADKAGDKPGDKPAEPPSPIKNHISHVVIYKVKDSPTNDATTFEMIKSSVVDDLVHPGGSGGGPAGPGGGKGLGSLGSGGGGAGGGSPFGGGGSSGPGAGDTGGTGTGPTAPPNLRDSWTPLGSIASSSAGSSSGMGGGFGMGGMGGGKPGAPGAPGAPGGAGGSPFGPGGNAAKTPAGKGTVQHVRTEFIVLFIWQEPTPSDKLRGNEEPDVPGR